MKKINSYGLATLVLGIFFFAFYTYFILGNQLRASRAVTKGRQYVQNVYKDYTIVGENCQGEDTNSDGYVTCNFRAERLRGEEKAITLQCPTFIKSFLATSCKEQGILINSQ